MAAEVKIIVRGADKIIVLLDLAEGRMQDLRIPLHDAGVYMLGSIQRNFQASGRPVTWQPLAFSTLKRKLRMGLSSKPLIGRTGRLRNQNTFEVQGTKKLAIGNSLPYGRIHQEGGLAGRGHKAMIPARPYLVFQDEDLKRIQQLVLEHIRRRET